MHYRDLLVLCSYVCFLTLIRTTFGQDKFQIYSELVKILGMQQIAVYCPSWDAKQHKQFTAIIDKTVGMSKGPHLDFTHTRYTSLVACLRKNSTELSVDELFDEKGEAGKLIPKLILYEETADLRVLDNVTISLHLHVFTFNLNTREFIDMYDVDGVRYRNSVGAIDPFNVASTKEHLSTLQRKRKDLMGKRLMAITDFQIPFQFPKEGYPSDTSPTDPVYADITGTWEGMFMDILDVLSRELNFTYGLYRRRDMNWGGLTRFENGTSTYTGMVGSLFRGEADFVAASLTLTRERIEAVDYVFPIATQSEAVYIRNLGQKELSWDPFYVPLTFQGWVAMFVVAVAMALIIRAFKLYKMQNKENHSTLKEIGLLIRCFLRICGSYFGGTDLSRKSDESALRLLVYFIILGGNVIWLAYQASLTSGLSVIKTVKPFHDLTELATTDFRVTITGNTNQAFMFQEAEPGSPLYDVYKKQMEPFGEDAYMNNNRDGLHVLMTSTDKVAFFDDLEGMNTFSEATNCEVVAPWVSGFPKQMSMAFPKSSPYFRIFNDELVSIFEGGVIDLLRSQWNPTNPSCFSMGGEAVAFSIGAEQMVSLFAMLGAGCVAALFVLGVEYVYLVTLSEKKPQWMEKILPPAVKKIYIAKCESIWRKSRNEDDVIVGLKYIIKELEFRKTRK